MKFNLEYDHVKENVLTNVLPHLEHIETREILTNNNLFFQSCS